MIKANILLVFISIIISFFMYQLMSYFGFSNELNSIIQTVIQSISGLMGFLLAAVALIFSFGENKKIERLKRSNQYKTFLNKYTSAIFWMGMVTISGIFLEIVELNYLDTYWLVFSLSIVTITLVELIVINHRVLTLTSVNG